MQHSKTHSLLHAGWVGIAFMTLLIGLTVSVLTFSVTQAQAVTPAVEPIVALTEPYIEYVPNTLLLKLKPGVTLASGQANAAGASVASSAESLNRLLSTLGATSAQPVFGGGGTNAVQASRSSAVGLERVYRVQWTSATPVEHAVAALAADVAVEYAEPDYVARPARIPDDPEYSSQWALAKINAAAAWDAATGDPNVIIAFVDSGVDLTHPDFAGRLWVNDDPPNGVDDDLNGKVDDLNGWNVFANNNDIGDSNGHGSRVGGVAGAATNNGVGVAGMCWNCSLMFVNAMRANNVANYSDVASAVQYAASNGAQVINLSLGGYADSAVLRDAVREAAITALVVGSAGNDDNSTPFYPAAYPEVLAVAATDVNDQKAAFSNYGGWIDVSAPGQDIRTTTRGGYDTASGTSLAAPLVAGLAGLIRSQQPAWTPEQVRWQILNTAVSLDSLNPARAGQLGRGRIDAAAALATTPQARAAVESYAIDGQSNARPAPGQAFQLVLNVRNLWLSGQDLQGTLTSSDPYVTLTDASGAFGDIAPGQLGSNSGAPFGVTISGSAPYNHAFSFTLNLSGAGGYSLAVPFTAQVRSAVETLDNTIYSANSTWTSDKIYVLNGSVIVGEGVSLTIQPGTVIKANPGKFIRVDGTLIARGTAAQPILFTTNSITNAAWSGIRFLETAVDASYDAAGNYLAGSVLQFVEVNSAELAVSLSTRSPYIADSTFRSNGTSLQIGNNNNGGSPRIERNEFWGNGNVDTMSGHGDNAIVLNGGQPLIQQNMLTGVSSGILGNGSPSIWNNTLHSGGTAISLSGSPSILGNVIQDNSGTAVSLGQSWWWSDGSSAPVIRNNVIVGNGGGVFAFGLQHVEIEYNLIANNGGGACTMPPCQSGSAAVTLDVQASGVSQNYPALAYHPGRDEYLAVWIESAASNAVKMLRLAADGAPLGTELLVSTSSSGHAAQVVYQAAQDRYFVVWAGTNDVQGRFVTADGQISGDVLSVSAVSSPSAVRVSYLPAVDNFLVAYQFQENDPCCVQKTAVQRLTAAGVPAGSAIAISFDTDMTGMNVYLGDLAVDASGKALVTLYSDRWGLYGAWIEEATQSVTATLLAEYDTVSYARRPAVAFGAGASRYAVMWEQTRGWSEWSDPRFLLNLPVNSDGTLPISPTLIFSDTGQAHSPRLVYGGTPNEFLATWAYNPQPNTRPEMDFSAAYRLYAQRLSENGSTSGPLIVVSSLQTPLSTGTFLSIGGPAVAYNSQRNEYLVVWSDTRTGVPSLWAQRLNAAGQLLDNGWTSADETNPVNNFRIGQLGGVRYNTIIHNAGNGLQLGGQAAGSVSIAHNNLFGNGTYDLYLADGQAGTQNFTVDVASNFWNIDASQIPSRIRDCTFDENGCDTVSSTVGRVLYSPPLANPEQEAPAFALSMTVTPQPVGMERGTVTIDFSRPMSVTALPAASFHDVRRGTTQQVISDTASVIGQDVLGRLWFGLYDARYEGGARVFDGRRWTAYTTANSGLGSNSIVSIYGAAAGDVWFGHTASMWDQAVLSRLQGSTWITYTPAVVPASGVNAIGQDNQGAMWFGTMGGLFRYDGTAWRQFTTADGLHANDVSRIARDGQGRMWFMGSGGGLSVFDGATWTQHTASTGMAATPANTLYADSQGRIWTGLYSMASNRPYLAMYDGAGWQYFGAAETEGRLNCDVSQVAESSDGTLWFQSCGRAVLYEGAGWSTASSGGGYYTGSWLFDRHDNFWYADWMGGGGTSVRWGGAAYSFIDGQWLSATRFQAGYAFDANIAPGLYTVQAEGVVDSRGMAAYAGSAASFQVDFGAGVSLDPPNPPQVTAQSTGSLNHLAASWQTLSPNVDLYRYAIGTTPGARTLVGWTYLAATSMVRGDLNLVQGQTYYVTVQARNTSGLWSSDSVSAAVLAGETPTAVNFRIFLPAINR